MSTADVPGPRRNRRGRPPSTAKRAAILAAATGAFLRDGYRETTLDAIAAAAGVSKQTIYSHFADKESLFAAVVEAARAAGPDPAFAPDRQRLSATDLRGSLTRFGSALLAASMSEQVAALRRVMIGELGRRPALRALWNRGAPNQVGAHLAGELHALAESGAIDIPDLATAVGQFMALVGHPANTRSLYGVVPLSDQDRHDIAAAAADMFIRAYGTERNATSRRAQPSSGS